MKLEHLLKILQKFGLNLIEKKNFYFFNFKKIKNLFFSSWKTSSFADYYWFLYSNKYFTHLKRYL